VHRLPNETLATETLRYFPSRFNLASKSWEYKTASRLLANRSMSSASEAAKRSSLSRDFRAASIVFDKQRTAMAWGMARSSCLQAGARLISQPPTPDRGSLPVMVLNITQRSEFPRLHISRTTPPETGPILTTRQATLTLVPPLCGRGEGVCTGSSQEKRKTNPKT
jgi:hypothetical protein